MLRYCFWRVAIFSSHFDAHFLVSSATPLVVELRDDGQLRKFVCDARRRRRRRAQRCRVFRSLVHIDAVGDAEDAGGLRTRALLFAAHLARRRRRRRRRAVFGRLSARILLPPSAAAVCRKSNLRRSLEFRPPATSRFCLGIIGAGFSRRL